MNEDRHHTAIRLTVAAIVVAVGVVGTAAWLPAQTPKGKLCCIGGTYSGTNQANAMRGCPAPVKEPFTMTIRQSLGCGAEVKGTITGASGDVNSYTGTLTAGQRRCCVLTGSFSDSSHPGHVVNFTGTFCLGADKKWHAKGTFTEVNSGDPCKTGGTWQVSQK